MVTKQVLRLAGLVALAACSTGPLGVCSPDRENPNIEVCPAPEPEQFATGTIPRLDQ